MEFQNQKQVKTYYDFHMKYGDVALEKADQESGELDTFNDTLIAMGEEPMTLEEYLEHR